MFNECYEAMPRARETWPERALLCRDPMNFLCAAAARSEEICIHVDYSRKSCRGSPDHCQRGDLTYAIVRGIHAGRLQI